MSGAIIYLAIVVVWAVVLVPRWLRRHDAPPETEPDSTGSTVEEPAGRVLARRTQAVSERSEGSVGSEASESGDPATEPAIRPRRRDSAARARRAIVRHRVVFCGLLLVTGGGVAAAWYGLVPWWSECAPALLVPVYLVHVRRVIVAEHGRRRRALHAMRRTGPAPVAEGSATALAEHWRTRVDPGMRVLHRGGLFDQHAAESWTPQRMPLPTYLTAPPAAAGSEPAPVSVEEYDELATDAPIYPTRRAVGD